MKPLISKCLPFSQYIRLIRLLILSLFVLLVNLAQAQKSVTYFTDNLKTGPNSRIFCAEMRDGFIYAGGQSFDSANKPSTPSLIKLDTSSKTIWTYTLNKQIDAADYDGNSIYSGARIIALFTDSTDIYVHLYSDNGSEIRKINQLTGEEIWKKQVPYLSLLTNAGSNYIICTYNQDYVYGYMYNLIDKATGETVMTKLLNTVKQESTDGTITVEPNGVTYISHDDSVLVYTSPLLSVLKWAVKTNAPGSIHVIQPNSDGYIYIAGSRSWPQTFFSGRIKRLNGETDWISGSNLAGRYLYDFVSGFIVKGDYVYASGQHNDYGSIYSSYHVCKYNRFTGKLLWETNYNPSSKSPSPGPGDPYAGINSIVVDENDNVYTNGYEYADDSRSGIWGICKFDSAGKLVYHSQVLDSTEKTQFGRGVFSFELNHHIFYLGELQNNGGYSNVFLLATDTSGVFKPYNKKKIISTYQEFSDVKQIASFSTGKYIVYKQIGNNAVVELKSAKDNSLVWARSFSKKPHSEADKLCVTSDNNIYISILGYPTTGMQYDYSAYADSMYFIKIDSTGKLLNETKYSIKGDKHFKSLQLYATRDTNTVFIYEKTGWNGWSLVSFFNVEKATTTLLDGHTDFYSSREPLATNQTYLVPLTNDVYAAVQNKLNSIDYPLLYQVSFKGTLGADYHAIAGYALPQFSIIYEKVRAHYVLAYDSTSVIILGTDGNGIDKIFLYDKNARSNTWKNEYPAADHFDMATLVSGNIFGTGRSGNSLLIQKLNAATGSQIWQQKIDPADKGQYFIPVEQKFNDQKKQYIISGYIADTSDVTNIQPKQLPFYIIADSNGTVISKWIQAGDYKQQNSLKAICVTPYAQSIIGGSLYKYPYGRSGILIEADTAIVPTDSTTNPVDSTTNPVDSTIDPVHHNIIINIGVAAKNKAEISWTVTPETNIDFYEIQHSTNKTDFEILAVQQPLTNTSASNTYHYTTGTLDEGKHYFRVRVVSHNGDEEYSDTVSVSIKNPVSNLIVSPNPVKGQMLIRFPEPVQNATILIYNTASGKVVKKIANISGTDLSADISDLAAGLYIIKAEDSENTFTGRFIEL